MNCRSLSLQGNYFCSKTVHDSFLSDLNGRNTFMASLWLVCFLLMDNEKHVINCVSFLLGNPELKLYFPLRNHQRVIICIPQSNISPGFDLLSIVLALFYISYIYFSMFPWVLSNAMSDANHELKHMLELEKQRDILI